MGGNGHGPDDWLDAWDPQYIRTTLPTLRLFSDVYHRAEVRGLDNIPAEGPVLLVGNHSGGTLISDTFVFAQAFYDHFGPLRRFHQLAHDLVFQLPGVRASLSRFGTVPASPENMARALERDAALLVYPGGDHETYRPSWESAEIDFAGRTRLREARDRARRADRAGGGHRRPGDGAVPRARPPLRPAAAAGQAAAPQGAARAGGPAVRRDRARPARPHPAAGEDHGPGAAADRPEAAAGRQAGHRRGLRARHRARCRRRSTTSTTERACR